MLKITGYSDQITVLPGEDINFFIHCEEPSYQAQLVRIRCGDINPEGPGLKEEEIDVEINGSYKGRTQTIHAGSYATIPLPKEKYSILSEIADGFCFETYIYPTLPDKGSQYIFDFYNTKKDQGFYLKSTPQGTLEAKFGTDSIPIKLTTTKPLTSHLWYRIICAFYQDRCVLIQQPLDKYHQHLFQEKVAPTKSTFSFPFRTMIIGGRLESETVHRTIAKETWNGKIDSPALIKLKSLPNLKKTNNKLGEAWVKWNFSKEIPTINIKDVGKLQLHGVLENLPTRGVTGYKYTGDEISWVTSPEQYSAIHFHEDDVYDAKWELDFTLTYLRG